MRNLPPLLLWVVLLGVGPAASAGVVEVSAADFAPGTDISLLTAGVRLSSTGGPPGSDPFVYSRALQLVTGGPVLRVYGPQPPGGIASFGSTSVDGSLPPFVFRADFDADTDFVAIDVIADDDFDPALMRLFDRGGTLLDTLASVGTLGAAIRETIAVNRLAADVASVELLSFRLVNGVPSAPESFLLDRLRFNRPGAAPEPGSLALALLAAPLLPAWRRRVRRPRERADRVRGRQGGLPGTGLSRQPCTGLEPRRGAWRTDVRQGDPIEHAV